MWTGNLRSGAPLIAALAFAATACSSAPSPVPSAVPSTQAPATLAPSQAGLPTPGATVPLGPSVRLTLDTSGPMVESDDGPAGRHWVLPAAGARDRDGGFVLFIVWFGDEAGDQIVTLARSDDGRAWRIDRDPILTDLGMDLVDPGAIPSAAIQLDDGTWRLYGWAGHADDPNRFTTWAASAPEPEGPWALVSATAVGAGQPGAWDSQMAQPGSVHRTANGYALWYEGEGAGSSVRGDVGLATSTDGVTWQKEPDPVIRRGFCGPGTSLAAEQPQVETWSGGYLGAIGAVGPGDPRMNVYGATSTDGRTWSCGSPEPLLRAADIPNSTGIHTIASLPLDGDRFELVIESIVDGRSELWSATVEVDG